ncbi:MAG TPA: NAD-dependent epimerase [Flavobacteriales bacterium]|jgi:nucleoside-diphosphate-sugar epimerase|nr:NAD-dependent epimerase/dehydratase family protein [Salibacteraceae bacterium]HAS34934.1 NAD-dependent epimerase [Flavobacteriales bacterium]
MSRKALIIGSLGQVGRELSSNLALKLGYENVLSTDVKSDPDYEGRFEILDCLDEPALRDLVQRESITEVYHLAALLSATAEQNIDFAWKLSVNGLFNVLNLAKDGLIEKIFWPSSIAVFGPNTPRHQTPQSTIIEPTTVYGIGKQAGEQWCNYYHKRFGVDVRSVRYPGLIGWKSLPGGGTTDYAVDIFYSALKGERFNCFLNEDTFLPMMHMEDAIRATLAIMEQDASNIKIRNSYNISAMSFSPKTLAEELRKHFPNFEIEYKPDFRQEIASSWPSSIDDAQARTDWGWKEQYGLSELVQNMIENLKLQVQA